MKRKICLLLAVLMLLSVVFGASACKKKDGEGEETTVSTTSAGGNGGDDAALYADLPTGNYQGYDFKILVAESDYAITTIVPTETTDSLNQAMFNRNSFVKETLNINITEVSRPVPAFNTVQQEIRNLNSSNTFEYGAVFNEAGFQTPLAQEGVYLAVDDYEEYLNLSKPWWFTDAMDSLKIDGRTCELLGDFHLMYYDSIYGMAFNQNQLRDNKIEFPYDLVREGKWTIAELKTMVSTINENQTEENHYGIVGPKDLSTAMITSLGFTLVEQDEDEILVAYENDELLVDIYEEILTFYVSNGDGKANWIHPDYGSEAYKSGAFAKEKELANAARDVFTDGRAAFIGGTVGDFRNIRTSEFDYGIIPLPKYSEEDQEQYVNFVYSGAASCGIPVLSEDVQRTCTILEYLSAYSYKLVKNEYYDVVVQTRTVRDNDSIEMLDIIFGHDELGTTKFEIDLVYGIGIADCIRLNLSDANNEVKSQLDGIKRTTVKNNIDKTIEAYKG